VVADDIADGVTEVARGADLVDQSAVQAVLWRALGAEPPTWLHAPLILGGDGKKLSKSHRAAAVGDLRELGWSSGDVWRVVLPWLGLAAPAAAIDARAPLHHALAAFDPARIPRGPFTWVL
jgi:glutamyl/glutaminyl-tRNA synthetase